MRMSIALPEVELIAPATDSSSSLYEDDGESLGYRKGEFMNAMKPESVLNNEQTLITIDADGTLLDFDVREVEISRAIIEHARKIVLVADSSKFSRSAPVRIAQLSEIDTFVTDRLPSAEIAEMCRRCGVEVIEAGDLAEGESLEAQKSAR